MRRDLDALAEQTRRLGEEALGQCDILGVAFEPDLVAAKPDGDARLALEHLEALVARAGEGNQDARVVDLDLGGRLDPRVRTRTGRVILLCGSSHGLAAIR